MGKKKDLRLLPADKRPKPSTGQSAPFREVPKEKWTPNQQIFMGVVPAMKTFALKDVGDALKRRGWTWRDVSNVVRGLVRSRWVLRTDKLGIYTLGDGKPPTKKRTPPTKAATPKQAGAVKEEIFSKAYAPGKTAAQIEKETGLAHGFVQRRMAKMKKEAA